MKSTASSLERLECRIAPANIVCTIVGHTLTITGTADSNTISLNGNADPTIFLVTALGDTVNGNPGATGFTTPAGITNIVVKLLGGDDSLTISNSIVGIHLKGNLKIDGGDGGNNINATDLTVDKNLTLTNGDAGGALRNTSFFNLNVGGSVTIRNGVGDSVNHLERNSPGPSTTIRGNVTIINGTGADENILQDLNVGGNVTIKNGHGNIGGAAGETRLFNFYNTTARSVIRGNLSVSYVDGEIDYDGLWDYEVQGNVTFNHGSNLAITHFDGDGVAAPVVIGGSLTVKGTGAATLDIGTHIKQTGLVVGKNVTLVSGGNINTLTFNKLEVGGATKIISGNGANTFTIDDSLFAGVFKLTGGTGADTVNIENKPGTSLPTIFESAATISTGDGFDNGTLVDDLNDAGEYIFAYSTLAFKGGDAVSSLIPRVVFPFGGEVQFS